MVCHKQGLSPLTVPHAWFYTLNVWKFDTLLSMKVHCFRRHPSELLFHRFWYAEQHMLDVPKTLVNYVTLHWWATQSLWFHIVYQLHTFLIHRWSKIRIVQPFLWPFISYLTYHQSFFKQCFLTFCWWITLRILSSNKTVTILSTH